MLILILSTNYLSLTPTTAAIISLPTCGFGKQRQAHFRKVELRLLKATEINNFIVTQISQCSSQCLYTPECMYITLNTYTMSCALYKSGPTIYDVSAHLTFVAEHKHVQVIIVIIGSNNNINMFR